MIKIKEIIDGKLLKYLLYFYGLIVLTDFIQIVYFKVEGSRFINSSWILLFLEYVVANWVIAVFGMILIVSFTNKMIQTNATLRKMILIYVFHSVVFCFIVVVFRVLIGFMIWGYVYKSQLDVSFIINRFFMSITKYLVIYISTIAVIYIYNYNKKIKNIENQKSQLQAQLATTKLNRLRAQIHPHFMFNTLNSISSLIEIDKEKSQNLIADFGDLFRELIECDDKNLIALEKELEFLNKYIDIISVRFSDHLIIHKSVDISLKNVLIPNMIIQPIIENALEHAYSYNKTELEIDLSIFKKGNYLNIQIKNNGEPLKDSFDNLLEKGNGLKITHERLKTLFKDDFDFQMSNIENNNGIMVNIQIPLVTIFD